MGDLIVSDNADYIDERENYLLGLLGAFLFSLIGGALWVALYYFNFFAWFCGVALVLCAIIGYRVFAKKRSVKGVLIAFGVALFTMVLSQYICLSIDVYYVYNGWYENGETLYGISFLTALKCGYQFLVEPAIAMEYLKGLGLGLVACILGSVLFFIDEIRYYNENKES